MTQAQLRSVLSANWARMAPDVRTYSLAHRHNCSQQMRVDPWDGFHSVSNRRERSAVAEVAWLSLR
jgi:hypothetical protein